MKRNHRIFLTLCAIAFAVAGCGKQQAGAPPAFAVQVRAVQAAREPIQEKISLVATLSANESVEIRSEMDGAVETINFQEGQPVTNGQLLFELDPGKVAASVAQAEANFKVAEANMQRAQSMLENKTISQQEYDQAKATFEADRASLELMKQQWTDSRITAKFDGIMGARMVSPGQVISKDKPLSTLVDLDPIKVEFHVPEKFVGQLQAGQAIEFRVAAYGDEVFKGDVYFIDPQVDENTRTVLVKATEPNADGRLRPGMFGNLDLILQVKKDAVTIPETALVIEGDKTTVYVVDKAGAAQMVNVDVGIRLSGKAEIVKGLQGGETVVTEGIQKLHPGATVTIAADATTNGH